MKKQLIILFVLVVFTSAASSQTRSVPWTEWSKKDAERILNDSAWGQTQSVGGTSSAASTSAITRTQGGGGENVNRTGESGESMGGPKPVYYRARFLTAKPIREAFARLVILSKLDAAKDLTDQLQGFIDRDFGNYLVVAFNIESSDARMATASLGALGKMNKEFLKDKVYLERKDGKRLDLIDYKPPINDNLGAKFIFERNLDGQPFLTADSDFVRFVVDVSEKMKLNLRFKVAAMTYGDKLEY